MAGTHSHIAGGSSIELSNTIPVPDNESDAAIRSGQIGTSTDAARADHNHPIIRQGNPGDPVVSVSGTGLTLNQSVILDRHSTEESYMYKMRVYVTHAAGTGWGYIQVPAKAGFQQPKITGIGTYRNTANAPQADSGGGAGSNGAAPFGPYMGKEAHEWSSTNRVYMGYNRRDSTFNTYVEFWVEYIRA